jgi:hypothetical protein
MAARTAAADIHRGARTRPKSAKAAIAWAEIVILSCLFTTPRAGVARFVEDSGSPVHRCQFGLVLP